MQRSIRRDGRVTSEYVASGETAMLIALLDADSREERDSERQEFQADRDASGAVERALNDSSDRVEDLACAALYADGFRRPERHGDDAVSAGQHAEEKPRPLPDIDTAGGVRGVLERAREGEAAMRPLVRQLLDRDRERGAMLMRAHGDICGHAQNAPLKGAAGDNITIQEALRRKIDAVRDELAGPDPSPLEMILCERVAPCWFDANEMDRRSIDQVDVSFKTAEYRESRRDRAHRRFVAACKALATIRKLAHQQVHVAGPGGGGSDQRS